MTTVSEQKPAATREALGSTLISLVKQGLDIVVVDADLGVSTTARVFGKEYPERFFTVGIAEQNLVGVSAGLASAGKTVFASSFAVFVPGHCFDQIRLSLAQPNLNVKLFATHAGLSVGEDGVSAQAIEDIALMCALPTFTVIVPSDISEATKAIEAAAKTFGPFYIRAGRAKLPVLYDDSYDFQIGKASMLRDGRDLTIIACGLMVERALRAAGTLAAKGIDARVLNMATLKPLDRDAIAAAARETGAILTAEEHLPDGGLTSLVARAVTETYPVPMAFVAPERYAESGPWDKVLEKYGLTAGNIAAKAEELLKRKG